jgi:hypothetical protein
MLLTKGWSFDAVVRVLTAELGLDAGWATIATESASVQLRARLVAM